MKEKIPVEELCKDLPKEFSLFAEHLNALKYVILRYANVVKHATVRGFAVT